MKKLMVVLAVLLLVAFPLVGACGGDDEEDVTPTPILTPTPTDEVTPTPTTIPPNWATYTDEEKLFSISYPRDWETQLAVLTAREEAIKRLLESIASDVPAEDVTMIFYAGLLTEQRFDPNVSIVVGPMDVSTVEEAAEAEILGLKAGVHEYKPFGQVKAVVGGRKAIIFQHESTIPGAPPLRFVQMVVLHGKTSWIVTCTTSPENFKAVEEILNQVVRSFRIMR